jgi:hypothetical protein
VLALANNVLSAGRSAGGLTKEACYRCEGCLKAVDRESPRILAAAELVYVGTVDEPYALAERRTVFFHKACWPGEWAGYRLKQKD